MASLTLPAIGYRERALKSLSSLPPFSPVLNRLLASIASEDISIQNIADIIQKDTVISGNILKLVNSAMYGRRGVVTSVTHAASLLGMNRLRNAVLGMSIARMWNQVRTPPTWSTARFNLHSVATALLSDMLAQRCPVEFPEGAFLGGLFHDVGKLLIVVGLPDEYQKITALYAGGQKPWSVCEHEVLGLTHADLSAAAVSRWRLPDPIRNAITDHHNTDPQSADVRLGTHRLSSLIRCADLYVNAAGISIEKERSPAEEPSEEPFSPLGLDKSIPEIIEEFHAEYEALSAFFR